jgi:ankyrin repeat protein
MTIGRNYAQTSPHLCPAGSHELLRMVLEARADPDARDSFGQTPLMMAAKQADGSAASAASCLLLEKTGQVGLDQLSVSFCSACVGSCIVWG